MLLLFFLTVSTLEFLRSQIIYINSSSIQAGSGTREAPYNTFDSAFNVANKYTGLQSTIIITSSADIYLLKSSIKIERNLSIICEDKNQAVLEMRGFDISVETAVSLSFEKISFVLDPEQDNHRLLTLNHETSSLTLKVKIIGK
jgi:hypothetical protein